MKSELHHSVSGYLGLLIGTFYMFLALSWAIWPTNARSSGIDWVNHSPVPIHELSPDHIMIWWALGGLSTVVGSILTFTHKLSGILIFASILTPMIIASLFAAAFFGGHSETGIVSAFSYTLYGLIVPVAVLSERRIFNRERQQIAEIKKGAHL